MTNATQANPVQVATYVRSASHKAFGRGAWNTRLTRSAGHASVAAYAHALRRVSFARRSSRFSLSSALSRARSSLVSPGRTPVSRSARRTHLRSVSAEQPTFDDTETIAAHCVPCPPWGSGPAALPVPEAPGSIGLNVSWLQSLKVGSLRKARYGSPAGAGRTGAPSLLPPRPLCRAQHNRAAGATRGQRTTRRVPRSVPGRTLGSWRERERITPTAAWVQSHPPPTLNISYKTMF